MYRKFRKKHGGGGRRRRLPRNRPSDQLRREQRADNFLHKHAPVEFLPGAGTEERCRSAARCACAGSDAFTPRDGCRKTSGCFALLSNGKLWSCKEVQRGQIQEAEGPVPIS